MPFIVEQFCIALVVNPSAIYRSIMFSTLQKINPSNSCRRWEGRLYLGSQTHFKVQRGAVSNLPSTRIRVMTEKLLAVFDWFRIKGITFKTNLITLRNPLSEKGVQTDPTGI